jgi:hypothetical protein
MRQELKDKKWDELVLSVAFDANNVTKEGFKTTLTENLDKFKEMINGSAKRAHVDYIPLIVHYTNSYPLSIGEIITFDGKRHIAVMRGLFHQNFCSVVHELSGVFFWGNLFLPAQYFRVEISNHKNTCENRARIMKMIEDEEIKVLARASWYWTEEVLYARNNSYAFGADFKPDCIMELTSDDV